MGLIAITDVGLDEASPTYGLRADKHIAIASGTVFSLTGRDNNYLRMHSGAVWDDQLRDGLFQLGRLIRENV